MYNTFLTYLAHQIPSVLPKTCFMYYMLRITNVCDLPVLFSRTFSVQEAASHQTLLLSAIISSHLLSGHYKPQLWSEGSSLGELSMSLGFLISKMGLRVRIIIIIGQLWVSNCR